MEGEASPRRRGRLKPILLAAAMAVLVLNVWIGSPLLALWIGSRVQGEESQPSMAAFVVVILALVTFSVLLYQLLKLTAGAYREATGTTPTVRTHAPWLRSLRDERPAHSGGTGAHDISGAERVVVVTVILAAAVFEIWFFFFSGSPIGSS